MGCKVLGVFQNINKRSLKSKILLRILGRDPVCEISVSIGRGDCIICDVVILPDHGEAVLLHVFKTHRVYKIRGAAIFVDPHHNEQSPHRVLDL